MGCKAQNAAIAIAMASICNAADRLEPGMRRALGFLGVQLDDQANAADAALISTSDSPVRVAMEPTNEEWIAADHALQVAG